MREDFHKIVVERPRWGSSLPSHKTRWSSNGYDPDGEYDLPNRESSSWHRNGNEKGFSDHLSPLRRWLGKQVGRPWHKVEGEILKGLDTRTVIGRHLLDHARQMVEIHCRIGADGRPYALRGYCFREFYVHPRSGLLLRAKPLRIDEAAERRRRIAQATKVRLDERTRAEKIGYLWYLFIDEDRFEEVVERRCDANGKPVLVRVQRPVIHKKQANTQEIRQIHEALEAALR